MTRGTERGRAVEAVLRFALAAAPWAALAWVLLFLARGFGRGFDLTDEAYYLIYAADAREIRSSVSQFGHYTGLLYALAGGSLFGFRLAGAALLLAAAAVFAVALERAADARLGVRAGAAGRIARLGAIPLAALHYYAPWVPTPSYNLLDLAGLLLAVAGLLLPLGAAGARSGSVGSGPASWRDRTRAWLPGALLLGAGGFLVFAAKPTSAALLAPLALLWLAVAELRRVWLPFSVTAGATAAMLVGLHVLVFQDGVASFAEEIAEGRALLAGLSESYTLRGAAERLRDGYSVVARRAFAQGGRAWWVFPALAVAVATLRVTRGRALDALVLLALLPVWAALWDARVWSGGDRAFRLGPGGLALLLASLLAVAVPALGLLAAARVAGAPGERGAARPWISLLPIGLLLLVVPPVYAFGSTILPLRHVYGAFVFHAAGALILLRALEPFRARPVAPLALAVLLAAGAVPAFRAAGERPQRLAAPLAAQVQAVELGPDGARVALDPKTARYVERLRELARSAGWRTGTPLVDLTGFTPGAAWILDARAPVTPWLLAGRQRQEGLARYALARVPPEALREAWVLTSPKGRRRLPDELLRELGLDFPERYVVVGELETAYQPERQLLWRPGGEEVDDQDRPR